MGMIGSIVMVSAQRASAETVLPVLERLDFTDLEAFGS